MAWSTSWYPALQCNPGTKYKSGILGEFALWLEIPVFDVKEDMISKEISIIRKKWSSLHWENRKHVRGLFKIFQCLPILSSGYNKPFWKTFPWEQRICWVPLSHRDIWHHIIVLIWQTLWSKRHTYCSNWHQILSLSTWYWICRLAEWKL